ncbi:transmembrane protease serine 9-like, partial [Battus philenor]|uniref:transmembrane protease serine 9-like n=1 Tax=Battus philenor TaxID=42288 RepID=UPI0035D0C4A5
LLDISATHAPRRVHLRNDGKIVGGNETTIQNYPYQVYLLLKQRGTGDYYQCGGSIATSRCILTAAHCLTGMESVNIRVGSTDASSGGNTYNSRILIRHPQYNARTSDFDVGVIKVLRSIALNGADSTRINYPSSGCTVSPGTNLTVTGWGDTMENGATSETLMAVTVNAVSYDECKQTYSTLTPRMICAGVPEGGRDSCQGDSGGPLVLTGSRTQVGVVSFGSGCARPNTPGVYSNLCNPEIQRFLRRMGYVCGKRHARFQNVAEDKIVGGTETTIQKYPYQAYLLLKEAGTGKYYQCGGSIATRRCILTAAHCLAGIESINVRVGSEDAYSGGTTYDSKIFVGHPKYDSSTYDYDVAVVKLLKPIVVDGFSSALVKLPSRKCNVSPGTNLTVTGWGDTLENGETSEILMEVTVSSVSYDDCKKVYKNLSPRMLCAGIPGGGRDSCQGDSGGPLTRTGTKTQVGIVSFGNRCARPYTPGVYTNICNPEIRKWIRQMGCA